VIQALALWRLAITKWYEARFNSKKYSSIALNRLDIPPVLMPHAKYNYFILPEVIEAFVKANYNSSSNNKFLKEAINKAILVDIFNNDKQAYTAYLKLDAAFQRLKCLKN
jgi:hypothetical protein